MVGTNEGLMKGNGGPLGDKWGPMKEQVETDEGPVGDQ